ncbi:DNA repair protein Rad50 [Poseidonibacter antarcticus]|uniref:DNA repair protein Rad50 n=1 Tax=Poseidonibacter antarcticus TaxID=2478538 RepID=UPI000EF54291|nr:DNA repair protein Rad50 [Poseidonibacter antarcticus]
MKNIKIELESIIFNVMLPELQAFLNELNEEIEKGNEEEEIIEAKKDIVSFIEELNQILKLIEEKKLSNKDAKDMYKKIRNMLDEHDDGED